MCRVHSGDPPDPSSFREFEKKAMEALHGVTDLKLLLDQAKRIDNLRFDTGDEWGEPHIFNDVRSLIFGNPDPNEGLLLFTLSCWLDMQAKYTTVWTTFLQKTKLWIDGKGLVPRGGFGPTEPHLLLTKRSVEKYKSLGQWFVRKITEIAEKHGHEKGNVYRLAGEMCSDLYSKPGLVSELRTCFLPENIC